MSKAATALTMSKAPRTNVATKRKRSKPRRVWNVALESPPPKALPRPAADCWRSTTTMRSIERTI